MSVMYRLTETETRLFFREPLNVFFVLLLPPLLILILGAIPSFREPDADLGGLRVIDLYVPIVIAVGIAVFALLTLPQQFAVYRDTGVLRRLRITPVDPKRMLAAQLLMGTTMSAGMVLVVLAIARIAFDVDVPRQFFGFLVAFALTAAAMFAFGLVVASLSPTATGATAIGTILLFPSLFFAGLWIPRGSMNDVLLTISDLTPLGAGVQSLHDATGGDWPQPLHAAVLLGWTIVAGGLAARYFRWE